MQLQTWACSRAGGRLLSVGVACCLALAALGGSAFGREESPPAPNDPVVTVIGSKTTTQIVERFSKIAKLPARIVRVDGFDPAVINVSAMSPTEFRLNAIAPGVTTAVFTDEAGGLYGMEIFVVGDVRHLQAYIDRLFPGSAVKAVAVKDSVVLRGWVTRPESITAIVEIAEQFYPRVLNQMQVGGAQQVILRVKVMEVQRSKLRSLGFNFLFQGNNQFGANTVGQLSQLSTVPGLGGGGVPGGGNSITSQSLSAAQLAAGIVSNSRLFQGFLEALKQENLLKILAEPVLNTSNGRPSALLAGGQFPVVVPQGLGRNSVRYKNYGVQLEAVPTILGNGRVRLELAPEISELDYSNALTIGNITSPALVTRRVNTQVEMRFGQTYMLAGLLLMRQIADTSKVPFFGELPFIGAVFRRVKSQETETELVILVTPELAGPMNPDQVPPGGPGLFTEPPTDSELYCDGLIELPNYGRCNNFNCELGGLPSSTMNYAIQCPSGQCQSGYTEPGSSEMSLPTGNSPEEFAPTPVPNHQLIPAAPLPSGQPMPAPPVPPKLPMQAPPAREKQPAGSSGLPDLPLPGPKATPVVPPLPVESSAIEPTAHKQWYQYNPRSKATGNGKPGSNRPGLIAPGG